MWWSIEQIFETSELKMMVIVAFVIEKINLLAQNPKHQ